MRKYFAALLMALTAMIANATPHCSYFNNDENKATIIFTDEEAAGEYIVSDVMLYLIEGGKGYEVYSIDTNVTDGVAKVTLTFQHLTEFSNPTVELTINGKKAKFNVAKLKGTWQ